ncbi:hypothetical protein ACM66B_007101 [Microbotryomycetes sp. NB124-2]
MRPRLPTIDAGPKPRIPNVLVRGSINIDEYFEVDHIVKPGETISSNDFSRRAGGKGANQAVAAAKAGAKSVLAACIGQDGTWLLDTLKGFGVETGAITVSNEEPTGRAVIQLTKDDNSIVLMKGANFATTFSDELVVNHLSKASFLLLQNEIPMQKTLDCFRRAQERGVVTVFNPSPMMTLAQAKVLPLFELDWLIVNQGEAREIYKLYEEIVMDDSSVYGRPSDDFDVGPLDDEQAEAVQRLSTLLANVTLSDINLTGIVMTMGSEGSVVFLNPHGLAGEGDFYGPKMWRIPAGKLVNPVRNTTGAGDCFTGYFVTMLGMLSEDPRRPTKGNVKSALQVASQAAAMCVEKDGAMESMPSLDEVRKRMVSIGEEWPLRF